MLMIIALAVGCRNDNMGFPRNIEVGVEGDTLLVRSVNVSGWMIVDKNWQALAYPELVETDEGGVFVTEYEWVTLESRMGAENDIVIVAPNATGEPRTVYLYYAQNSMLSSKEARIAINQR